MNPRRTTRIRLEEVRPLGARLTFIEKEWLPSMFRRIGHSFGTSSEDIADWCGLRCLKPGPFAQLGNALPSEASAAIEVGLGFTTEQLQTTVMGSLPPELISLRGLGKPVQSKDWTRGGGTRYCVECLRERPGVLYTYWRLWWSFICERHHTLLRATCPACRGDVVEATLREREMRDPSLCWSTLPDGDSCRHPLADTWDEEPVDPDSPMLHAQLILARGWTQGPTDLPHVSPNTLRGTGIALLGAGDLGRIAALARVPADEIVGLFDQRERTGGTPPQEPLAMAALLGAAYRLITDPEQAVRKVIRETTFIRPVRSADAVEGPGSARYLLSYWPGIDRRMRGRVLRALDSDLPAIQRLVHGSAASAEVFEALQAIHETPPHDQYQYVLGYDSIVNRPDYYGEYRWSERFVPRLMWPSWAAPLGVDDRTEAHALQIALADALRIAGTGTRPDADAIAGIGRRLRPSMLGDPGQTDAVLQQICELALFLRSAPGPIDYEHRLTLPTDQLLLEDHWQMVVASVGESPGQQRRLLNARRYAFLRMSAGAAPDLPDTLRFRPGTSDVADYTEFMLTMTAELKVAIDGYLVGWLQRFESQVAPGRDHWAPPESAKGQIVVAYEPPRFRHAGARLAPELDDIDLPTLHDLIGNGVVGLGVLSEAVDRAPRHVRWAIAAHPVPSGRLISYIDWTNALADLPDRSRVWPARESRHHSWRPSDELAEGEARSPNDEVSTRYFTVHGRLMENAVYKMDL